MDPVYRQGVEDDAADAAFGIEPATRRAVVLTDEDAF